MRDPTVETSRSPLLTILEGPDISMVSAVRSTIRTKALLSTVSGVDTVENAD